MSSSMPTKPALVPTGRDAEGINTYAHYTGKTWTPSAHHLDMLTRITGEWSHGWAANPPTITLAGRWQVWLTLDVKGREYRVQVDALADTIDRVLCPEGKFLFNRYACPPVYAVRPARVAAPVSTSSMKGA